MNLVKIPQNELIVHNQIFKTDNHPVYGKIYPSNADLYVCQDVLDKLLNIAKKSNDKWGVTMCIFDAYRPFKYQQILLERQPNVDEKIVYVSGEDVAFHCRGIAVDIAFLKDGKLLNYPPVCFDEKAHHNYIGDLSIEQINNRNDLKNIMVENGFEPYEYEWWHYNLIGWKSYPILSVDFDQLENTDKNI